MEAWQQATLLSFRDKTFKVIFNCPKVSKLAIVDCPMVDIPLYPLVAFSHATLKHSKYDKIKLMLIFIT